MDAFPPHPHTHSTWQAHSLQAHVTGVQEETGDPEETPEDMGRMCNLYPVAPARNNFPLINIKMK